MRKILLSEVAIYCGQVKMPEDFEIDREIIFYEMLKEGVNDTFKETPFTKELDKLKTYIREYIFIKHNAMLENDSSQSNFYFPQERSKPLTHLDPMNLTSSPDYVCLYGVNVGQNSCNVIIEYDENRVKGKIIKMSLNNNSFIMFPSNLKYHIDKNRSEQLNCILTLSYKQPK